MTLPASAPTWAALAVLVAFGAVLLARSRGRTEGGPDPAIYAMFEAAGKGDANAYLACFGGELLARLQTARREAGEERFAEELRRGVSGITGIAISRPPNTAGTGGAPTATLRVEQVFRDRNETKDFSLRRERGRWRIESIGPAATVKMPIPYGTPVYAPEPSAAPAKP